MVQLLALGGLLVLFSIWRKSRARGQQDAHSHPSAGSRVPDKGASTVSEGELSITGECDLSVEVVCAQGCGSAAL